MGLEACHGEARDHSYSFGVDVGAEESEELLKQYVQDALIIKSSGGGSKLYDQCVLV